MNINENLLYEVDRNFALALEASQLKKDTSSKLDKKLIVIISDYFLDIPLASICEKVNKLFDLTQEVQHFHFFIFYTGSRLETSLRLLKQFDIFKKEIESSNKKEPLEAMQEFGQQIISGTKSFWQRFSGLSRGNDSTPTDKLQSEPLAIATSSAAEISSNSPPFLTTSIAHLQAYLLSFVTVNEANFSKYSFHNLTQCMGLCSQMEKSLLITRVSEACKHALEDHEKRRKAYSHKDLSPDVAILPELKKTWEFTLFPLLFHVLHVFGELAGKASEEKVRSLINSLTKETIHHPNSVHSSYNFYNFLYKYGISTSTLSPTEKECLKILFLRLNNGLEVSHQIKKLNVFPVDNSERENFRSTFKKQIKELGVGQGVVFYSGYSGKKGETGHAILYEIEKHSQEIYKLRMINTGAGLHEITVNGVSTPAIFQLFDLNNNFDQEERLCEVLFNFDNHFEDTPAIHMNLLQCQFSRGDRPRVYEESDFKEQIHGSCTFLPLLAWLKNHLISYLGKERGEDLYLRFQKAFIVECLQKINGNVSSTLADPDKFSNEKRVRCLDIVNQIIQLGLSLLAEEDEGCLEPEASDSPNYKDTKYLWDLLNLAAIVREDEDA